MHSIILVRVRVRASPNPDPNPHPGQVAFHTILKGSIPLFVLLCGWLLGLEPCRLLTLSAIVLVCGGIGLACSAEVNRTR